jgi:hypothetical protein
VGTMPRTSEIWGCPRWTFLPLEGVDGAGACGHIKIPILPGWTPATRAGVVGRRAGLLTVTRPEYIRYHIDIKYIVLYDILPDAHH